MFNSKWISIASNKTVVKDNEGRYASYSKNFTFQVFVTTRSEDGRNIIKESISRTFLDGIFLSIESTSIITSDLVVVGGI